MYSESQLVKQFGLAAINSFTSAEILKVKQEPYYQFNRKVKVGRFPKPDFSSCNLRGWKDETLARYDKDLLRRLIKVRCFYQ